MQQAIPIIVTGSSHHHNNTFAKRTRRISSSAAAKRFPKDFFKDQHCLHPIKSNRPNLKNYEPFLFDTFSQKHFAAANLQMQKTKQIRNESGNDTPKFKQRSSTIQHMNVKTESNRRKNVKKTNQDSCDSPLINKYNTISPQKQKMTILAQKKESSKQQRQQKQQKMTPFNAIPFISNFNITLGQKLNMMNLLNKKTTKQKKIIQIDEKQNNLDLVPCLSARRENNNVKNQGFRIRKKLVN